MGGLVVARLLSLVFLPALYVAWFRIWPEGKVQGTTGAVELAMQTSPKSLTASA
jgi:multidrug efflux pump